MPQTLKIKVEATQSALSDFINRVEKIYLVVHTSKIIDHRENELSHVYITLVDVGK